MLNKDQYNQEEYNDYYRQEIEGAEIEDAEEEGSLISKILILLILLALAIAGYFGYKAMNNTSLKSDIDTSLQVSAESSLPKSLQEEPEKELVKALVKETKEKEPANTTELEVAQETKEKKPANTTETEVAQEIKEKKPANTIETEVAQETESTISSKVTKAVNTQGKMSPEEIANVVAAVMQQMNQEKGSNTLKTPALVKEDIALINELSDSEVDSVSADLIKELEDVDISENTKIDNSKKQIDVYNKIDVQDTKGVDTLSQLSNQIDAVMAEGINNDKDANYTNSLKSEVDVRKNEMRIIVVRKGDTLGLISKRAYGNMMDYTKIYRANPEVTRPDRIYIGQKLRIPN